MNMYMLSPSSIGFLPLQVEVVTGPIRRGQIFPPFSFSLRVPETVEKRSPHQEDKVQRVRVGEEML